MKKSIAILSLIVLAAWALSATRTPIITYDPNSFVESPTDPNNVTVTIQFEITKEQYKAMQHLDISLTEVVAESKLSRTLNRLIVRAKADITQSIDVNDLKTRLER